MHTFRFVQEQRVARPLAIVFPFFAEARNLEAITPPWLHFRILNQGPIVLRRGTIIDYRLRLHGIPFRWQSVIDDWDPPVRFVDRQTRGPYRLWRHEHRFEERDGGTLIRDEVMYAILGPRWIGRLLVAPSLERIFAYRRQIIARHFAAGP
jgi:ligand-binding SRPBCC domain-containing protein